jgi:hypothetical protein
VRSRDVWPSHLDPEALAWAGLSCPSRHRLTGLIRRSGDLPPLPSRAGYRPALDIQGSSCLVSRPSELSLRDSPELPSSTSAGSPVRAYPHFFRTGTGHRVKGGSSWHSENPLESASCGSFFRRLVRSLSLRPFWLFAPWADPTETVRCLPGRLGLVLPGCQPGGSPRRTAGYRYGATWGPAPAGLAPASRSASFAAFLSQASPGARTFILFLSAG